MTREEKPQSPIVALNGEARDKGLTEGMRYASALSLVPGLRARGVPAERIGKARERIAKLLSRYTPDVEPCPFDQGAFWVSLEGLRSLFGTEERWRSQVSSALELQGFPSAIVSGFTRFGTYVLACAGTGTRGFATRGFATRDQEWDSLQRSSVNLLPLPHRIRGILRKLEIRTVGQFVRLPAGEMLRRLGTEAGELRAAILSDDPLPIQPLEMKEPVAASRRLDAPRSDTALLLPHIEELVSAEAERAEAQRSVISALVLSLRTEDGEASTDLIRPAAPTRSTSVLMRLIRLRLSERRFASGVERIEVRCAHARPSRAQEELFTSRGRDLASGARAFALVRARFGESSVSCARLRSSHLPEDSFQWVPMERPVL
ncbi:MAG TPA: hypothetical protein VMF68_10425, partial [Spirochaetia bacterium]|nr:hypothetical protein [Spirochaetia bacterium]